MVLGGGDLITTTTIATMVTTEVEEDMVGDYKGKGDGGPMLYVYQQGASLERASAWKVQSCS